MQTTTVKPGAPTSREVWFKNLKTKQVAVVTVEPGQSAAQALAARKQRSLAKGHTWELMPTQRVSSRGNTSY